MKKIVVVSVLIIALIGLVFIWPTPYRYYTLRGSEVERLTRINRFTGTIERLNNDGWHEYGRPAMPGMVEAPKVEAPAAPAAPIKLPPGYVEFFKKEEGKP
jgi:hypothetical protein